MKIFFSNLETPPIEKQEKEQEQEKSKPLTEKQMVIALENLSNNGHFLGEGNYGRVSTLPDATNYCCKTNRNKGADENDPVEEIIFLDAAKKAGVSVPTPRFLGIEERGDKAPEIHLVMDTIDGLSIENIIANDLYNKLPPEFNFNSFCDESFSEIEKMNETILHRDIKPGNIIIDKNGKPVIIDFGQAKWKKEVITNENITFSGDRSNFIKTKMEFGKYLKSKGYKFQ